MRKKGMKSNKKLVVLEGDAVGKDVSWNILQKYGELKVYGSTTQEQVKERIQDADIVIPNKLIIGEENLAGTHIELVAEAATGYNNIDISYCEKQGIAVTNVAAYSTASVAQHTLAMLLYLYEKLDYYYQYVQDGRYARSATFGHIAEPFRELEKKRWGIIGLGSIGRQTAKLAEAFGCEVVYYSASGRSYEVPYQQVSLEQLLTTCDMISIHCPLTEKTHHLIGYTELAKMKRTAVLINVARGPVVDELALARALEEGQIAAAGLDVFEQEPIRSDSPLLRIQDQTKLVMTPHIGWGSVEARTRLLEDISKSIEVFLVGEKRSRIV